MMVPQLQGALLDDLFAVDPTVEWCYDPFAGSGTVLTECMRRELNFIGTDLNPLAVLIMAVKARPLKESTVKAAVAGVLQRARGAGQVRAPEFAGRDKWFTAPAAESLARLRAAIQVQQGRPTRRFLWVCLAATVRLVSNSRTSTFKLHSYAPEVLAERKIDVLDTFGKVAAEAVAQIGEQSAELRAAGSLTRGNYCGEVRVHHADALGEGGWRNGKVLADVLMTSPPYGDNRTTVPYGQHSYLPLMWIDRGDLPAADVDQLLGSPYRIDVASVGGRRVADRDGRLDVLCDRSPAIADTAAVLRPLAGNGLDRFLAFCSDLDKAIETFTVRLRPGAIQFWTLGNRRISGQLTPTSTIVSELAAARGGVELVTLHRRFPRNAKRMATRNDTVALMDSEQILVLQTARSTTAGSTTAGTRLATESTTPSRGCRPPVSGEPCR
jgi:site-specific DNA-methyltransferase (cytosine-N4-specific)